MEYDIQKLWIETANLINASLTGGENIYAAVVAPVDPAGPWAGIGNPTGPWAGKTTPSPPRRKGRRGGTNPM